MDKTAEFDQIYIRDIVRTIQMQNEIFEHEKGANIIDSQNKFWQKHKNVFDEASKLILDALPHLKVSDLEHEYEQMQKHIANVDILMALYEANMQDLLRTSDLESRKWTILIGIDELKRYQRDTYARWKHLKRLQPTIEENEEDESLVGATVRQNSSQ